MSNIVLSAGIRSNLLALQQNSADQAIVNNALSTGKKVNTALDDPLRFFSAQNFDTRSSALSALLDNIGLGINTIKQANDGITAITNVIQTVQANLRNALQSASTNAKLASGSNTNGQLINYGPDFTGTYPSLLTTGTPPGAFSVGATLAITATNSLGATVTLNTRTLGGVLPTKLPTVGATLTAAFPNPLPFTIRSAKDLADAINYDVNNVDPVTTSPLVHATVDAGGRFIIENVSGTPITTGAPANAGQLNLTLGGAGVSTVVNDGLPNLNTLFGRFPDAITPLVPLANVGINTQLVGIPSTLNNTRATSAATYRNTLQQITNIAKDAGYNGTNLLYGDSLNLVLNENNTTNLVVTGVIYDATGLNIKRADVQYNLQSDTEVNTAIGTLQTAINALQAQAAAFATNNTVATTRQQFTTNTVKTLTDGSSLLTLADQNQEGASLLALQTRQQLSTQALSLANQSDKAVLRLFN